MAGLRHRQAFKKPPEYCDALMALNPECPFGITGNDYSTLQWFSSTVEKPKEEEIKIKLAELTVEYEKQKYKWERYKNYLTVEEQLNQLWDDMRDGIIPGKDQSEWFNYIKEIKEQNPKPE